mmetsp:Transcript_9002/g.11232  ORF Transcript_9002/g.11232 Transcript_9002/m.11232 type:complete len:519 (+) Transcript_9002:20-1576(+)
MALRLRRGLETDKPEPFRKKRKIDDKKYADNPYLAEIDPDKTMTADERRLEIGKQILKSAMDKSDDISKIHDDLQTSMLESEGKLRYRYGKTLRDSIQNNKYSNIGIKSFRGHRLSVTCLALDNVWNNNDDNKYCVTGSKDGSIIKWDINTGKKLGKVFHAWPMNRTGYSREVYKKIRPKPVLCVAISPNNKWLVSGGDDELIRIWHFDTLQYKNTFRGHRSSVTGLGFNMDNSDSNTLYTTGFDRQIRVYDINEMGFAEQLYGHTLNINCIDTINNERCLTCSDDRTIRFWKLKTQSQVIFENAHKSNIDTCCMITGNKFISGDQQSDIILWQTDKKKPLFIQNNAHTTKNGDELHWITSLSCKRNADVFSSGSSDGVVRIWLELKNSFVHVVSIQIPKGGFINSMKWNNKGDKIICGIGREHRFGRWLSCNGARNGICIIKLPIDALRNDSINNENMEYTTANAWDKWSKKEINGGKIITKKVNKDDIKTNNDDMDTDKKDLNENEWTDFFGEYFD